MDRKGKSTGTTDADLAAFRAEIEALEGIEGSQPQTAPGTTNPGPDGVHASAPLLTTEHEDPARASTPEELEFEDDDGTWYVWHPVLRKYLAKGGEDAALDPSLAAAVVAAGHDPTAQPMDGAADEYDPEMMTYSADDEVLPSLSAARAAHEEARAIARGDEVAPAVGQQSVADQSAAKKGKVSLQIARGRQDSFDRCLSS